MRQKYLDEKLPGFTGATFLVDNTGPFTSHIEGYRMPCALCQAIGHVIRNASKLLELRWALRVSHKGLYGYGKQWQADMHAQEGRKQQLAWLDPKAPVSPVIFDDCRYGFLAGRDPAKSLLVDFWIISA